MPVGTISLKYTTKNFPIEKSYDTRVNVKDTIEYLRFSTVFDDNAVGLAFIDAPSISVDDNILISDSASEIAENSRQIKTEIEYLSDSFITPFASFYITDVTKMVDGEEVPMYLWHDLTNYPNISRLEVLDGALNPVDDKLWEYIDETATLGDDRRGIYTNLECSIDRRSSNYEVFYVRFRNDDTSEIETVLLNSAPFYSQASFLSDRRNREFIVSALGGEYQVDVVFDSLNFSPTGVTGQQRYFLKDRDKGKIYIEKPAASLVTQRWNLRVSPGDFGRNGRRYWVPEYYTQLFSPAFPFRLEKEREVLVLDGNILYTDLYPISNIGIEGFYLYIIIKDNKGAVQRAITNDPDADTYITKQGFVTDVFYEKDIIESVSDESGFIKLKERIPSGLRAFLTYRYEENFFTYEDLSVNPSINPEILGKRIIMYALPDASDRAVHHLITDNQGVIQEASETDRYKSFEGTATSGSTSGLTDPELPAEDFFTGFEIEILSGLNSGIKVQIAGYDIATKTITFADTLPNAIEQGTNFIVLKKVENYSTTDNTLGQTYNYTGWEGFATAGFYMKLADVFVIQNLNISDIQSFDSRIAGGGLKDEQESAGLQLQDEARWYWDIGNFDGTPYPGMGSILIELPRYLLKELGGPFERGQVREIVMKHIGEGSYPVIRYYDESTEINDIEPGDGQVYVKWDLIDANQYNIYLGNSPDNLFLVQSQPGTRNEATLTELENNKIYYIQIEPIVGGIARLRSRTISFMPFNFSNTLPPIKYNEGLFSGGTYE